MTKITTAQLIDKAILKRCSEEKQRNYMGASGIGEECDRKLWYSYKLGFTVDDPKLQRIFDVGHILEDYIVKLLRDAGLTVHTEMENGEQYGFTDEMIAGHIDGVVTGIPEDSRPHLFEAKTAKDARWKEFKKKGCKSDPKYWCQVHTYMYKMGLERCIWVCFNKNTQELYIEFIDLDISYAESKLIRAMTIADTKKVEDLERKYNSAVFFKCKWCDYNEQCWKETMDVGFGESLGIPE